MSDLDGDAIRSDRDSESRSIRGDVEAAVAAHTPQRDPAVDSAVALGVEHHRNAQVDLATDHLAKEAKTKQSIRDGLRGAFADARAKEMRPGGTAPAAPSATPREAPTVPPAWDDAAKEKFAGLPQEVRLAVLRDQENHRPHMERLAEIDRHIAPVRDVMRQQGAKTDGEAIGNLLRWEASIRNPQTRAQALHSLAQQYGTSLHEVLGMAPQQQYQASPEQMQVASRQVQQFSQGRPHFETVRETMGLLIDRHGARYLQPNGAVNLDAAYREACKLEGIQPGSVQRPLPPAPRKGETARTSVQNAMRQGRGR